MPIPTAPTAPRPSATDRPVPHGGPDRARSQGFRDALGPRPPAARALASKRPTEGPASEEASGRQPTAGPSSRRRPSLEPHDGELQPFLPLPGVVRTVQLAPPPGLVPGAVDRAAELAALVDRAVESLRVGRSAEGHEARIRVRLVGAREPVEVRLVLRTDRGLEAHVLSEGVDRPEAQALARRLARGLAERGLSEVRVDLGALDE